MSFGIPIYLVRCDVHYWSSLTPACLLASAWVAIASNLFAEKFIAGFTVGAVK